MSVFLNLSNHPVATWPETQREAARSLALGEPSDLPGGMPPVDPRADRDDITRLADQVAHRALAMEPRGAFVAGEFTLTVALVRALQSRGVRCFSATSERIVEEVIDGEHRQKTASYRFVRWREYG